MSILIDTTSRVVVQGITGRSGLFHTQQCRAYGTNIVAGVTPEKGEYTLTVFRCLTQWRRRCGTPKPMCP